MKPKRHDTEAVRRIAAKFTALREGARRVPESRRPRHGPEHRPARNRPPQLHALHHRAPLPLLRHHPDRVFPGAGNVILFYLANLEFSTCYQFYSNRLSSLPNYYISPWFIKI